MRKDDLARTARYADMFAAWGAEARLQIVGNELDRAGEADIAA